MPSERVSMRNTDPTVRLINVYFTLIKHPPYWLSSTNALHHLCLSGVGNVCVFNTFMQNNTIIFNYKTKILLSIAVEGISMLLSFFSVFPEEKTTHTSWTIGYRSIVSILFLVLVTNFRAIPFSTNSRTDSWECGTDVIYTYPFVIGAN